VINQDSSVINDIESGSLSPAASWIVMIVALAGLMMYLRDHRRRAAGLVAPPLSITALKIAVMAIAGVVVVLVGSTTRSRTLLVVRGLPYVVLVVLAILVIYTVLLGRTGLAATSMRSAVTPRRPGGRASTPTGSGSRPSRCAGSPPR